MLYLESFTLPSVHMQDSFLGEIKRTCYTDFYPFRVFNQWEPEVIQFAPVTIFYGGNGSGKTTLLNVIAESLKIRRGTVYNKSFFFPAYVKLCRYNVNWLYQGQLPESSRIITSDDVFDYLIDLRYLNSNIDNKRESLLSEYTEVKYSHFQLQSLDDYEQLKRFTDTQRKSGSQYARDRLMQNIKGQSNGESAFMFFTREIRENSLYLLDEPENSLSAEIQLKLLQFIWDSARFYNCQFIISTHSPFIISMKDAVIYDLDEKPMVTKKWTELRNIQIYREFFKEHEAEFEK
ncbi:MAG: AAA family ATPase [Syntrophomonadaceae bacterium]|nr:AAA family ATPase [Syntrophomonadaceae bacterium]